MKLAIVYSRAVYGIKALLVTVEVHLSNGVPAFNIVGLPEATVKESKHRVRSAILNSQFEFSARKITVNLGPADLPKESGRFDLPIAIGILAASKQIPHTMLNAFEFAGELALSGEIRSIQGILPLVLGTKDSGRELIIPMSNAEEAAVLKQTNVLTAYHLLDVCAHLKQERSLPVCSLNKKMIEPNNLLDLADIKGQAHAKRALEIAAAGKHSLLLVGPPGTGKTMLATRMPSILPLLSENEAMEVATIASISRAGFNPSTWRQVPFRSPHHSSSSIALVGGGRPPRPGEVSLSHHGILFLDELPEFNRHVLESLREPLESNCVTVSRAGYQITFPAAFQFIAAMNPCPCGYAGSRMDNCHCSPEQIKRYLEKISGPLLDRIDMQIEMPRLPPDILLNQVPDKIEKSNDVLNRVVKAHELQIKRQKHYNAFLTVPELDQFCKLQQKATELLNQALVKFNLSARAYHRIIKVSRTLADLENCLVVNEKHISEALNFRCLDRAKRHFYS